MKKWCRTFLLSCLLCLSLCTLAQATDGETLRVGLKYGRRNIHAPVKPLPCA